MQKTTIPTDPGHAEHATMRLRIAAGRERLAEAVIERASKAIEDGLSLQMRAPGQDSTAPYGDLVPLGFLAAALRRIGESDGPHSNTSRTVLPNVIEHLEQHRTSGFWGCSSGCIPTSTDTALVALSGVIPDFGSLDQLRGPAGGFTPHRCSETGEDFAMKRSAATAHWEEEDVPTTALLESLRVDNGLDPAVDAKWFLARFPRWGGLYFNSPMFGLWAMSRISRRLGPWEPLEADAHDKPGRKNSPEAALEHQHRSERETFRSIIIRMLAAQRTVDGGFGRFDPVLNNSLAVLACAELDVLDRAATIAQLQILDAWEQPRSTETPFHSTLALPRQGTFEAMMQQQQLPASALLHEYVHQVSTHEDPHRLITTALACLALHVDADPARTDRFLHVDHLPISRPWAISPIEQALQHVRPYCEPHEQPSLSSNDPFCLPSRRVTLRDAIESCIDRLGPTLVTPATAQRLLAASDQTKDEHIGGSTFALEVRLHGGDDVIDFMWCACRASRNLFSLLNLPDSASPLRHLARLWRRQPDEEKPTIAYIDQIWFEFDLVGPHDLPPAFFFGPSQIQQALINTYGLDEVATNVRRITRSLELGPDIHDQLLQTADLLERFGLEEIVFQTGLMFSRPGAPVRICFAPLPVDEATRLLDKLGLDYMLPRCKDVLTGIGDCGFKTAVCIDATPDGASPRIGLEMYPPDRKELLSGSRYSALCDWFVEHGSMDASRAQAFLASQGWDELSRDGGCNRRINHFKAVVNPTGPLELKGYLFPRRTKRPFP